MRSPTTPAPDGAVVAGAAVGVRAAVAAVRGETLEEVAAAILSAAPTPYLWAPETTR